MLSSPYGSTSQFGVTWLEEEQAYNFAIYSRHAEGVTLLLYAGDDVEHPLHEIRLHHRVNKSGRVWYTRLPRSEIQDAMYYAYRVHGVFEPAAGHRFDTSKILLDPYAKAIHFPEAYSREESIDDDTNAGQTPLGVLPAYRPTFDWGDDRRPRRTASDLVIYEMHVRGFTASPTSDVSDAHRGTFAGVIEKIPYLKALGVTAVELMPVHQFDPLEGNYWGYMTLNFFSVHQSYSLGYQQTQDPEIVADEFREMVKALHAADISVILDVVFNHTAEGDERGPTYSYRGIDNRTYYLLEKDNLAVYRNDAGTGNVLRVGHPYVQRMILDSLRYWVTEMHVDGFRFDLASIFARDFNGNIRLEDTPIIYDITHDPTFEGILLIAEAWDTNTYLVGRQFPGYTWLQWNDRFRNTIRSFVRGDHGHVADMMNRMYGSRDDLFPDSPPDQDIYHPYQSVNYVNSHDGFCLYDLVSYNHKRNWANGHWNNDGTDYNLSWNCGHEGDVDVPDDVLALREQQIKNFCSLLFLSNGTPMFCAGDEFCNTQFGNNNPYNQDNETSWLDWSRLEAFTDVHRFWKLMIDFRKRHRSIGRPRFWLNDVRWHGTGERDAPDLSWHARTVAYCLHGASREDVDLYIAVNAHWEPVPFTIMEGKKSEWKRAIDTSRPSPDDIAPPGEEARLTSLTYEVQPRSVVVFVRNQGTDSIED